MQNPSIGWLILFAGANIAGVLIWVERCAPALRQHRFDNKITWSILAAYLLVVNDVLMVEWPNFSLGQPIPWAVITAITTVCAAILAWDSHVQKRHRKCPRVVHIVYPVIHFDKHN